KYRCQSPAWMLVFLAGCHLPAARFPTDSASSPSCPKLLACQLIDDSATTLVHHPVKTCYEALAIPTQNMIRVTQGAFEKRVLLPLSTPLSPLDSGPVSPSPMPDCDGPPPVLDEMQPAQVQLHVDGADALAALEQLIDRAACRIDVLMFQWENDDTGAALAARLAAKARPCLRVRILVDGGGNLCFGHPCREREGDVNGVVRTLAAKPYVEVIRNRNPFARFDHRKLVVVDGRWAWTGGRNFLERAFF